MKLDLGEPLCFVGSRQDGSATALWDCLDASLNIDVRLCRYLLSNLWAWIEDSLDSYADVVEVLVYEA